ncbi:MAG: PD-(D/E)XK nuclease family protein [Crocinitomicaceae bacterium]|nr:PD-(D/E)XK nuclease family protein [Crocinitomicaceae bacterium]
MEESVTFIERIVDDIHRKDLPLENLTIVLPSQRAGKYFQKALFQKYNRPIFSPTIVTMNNWIKNVVERPILEPIHCVFELYHILKHQFPKEDKGLDEFLKWGPTLLNDFNEIDRYLINSKDLFRNLADIKDIENWSFNSETLTPAQERFMAFWDLLPSYYEAFQKFIHEKEVFYSGAAYRYFAENIDLAFSHNKAAHFLFAGFNALSKAEISIMQQLEKMGRADVYIEADTFYMDSTIHEAGMFLRKIKSNFSLVKTGFISNHFGERNKQIHVINCAQSSGQAKVMATILEENIRKEDEADTLLLLANEQLVLPVIKNIPKSISKANITLGLPLKYTPLKTWLEILFHTQEGYEQFKKSSVYYKHFLKLIKHPFLVNYLTPHDTNVLKELENKILEQNWVFVYWQQLELSDRLTSLFQYIFTPWRNNWTLALQNMRKLNEQLFNAYTDKVQEIEKAIIYQFDQSLIPMETLIASYQPDISLRTFKQLFHQHWSTQTLAYYGNPLDGLQVMGLLETRLLNFKKMIVIGLNDGSLPPDNPIQTLIPMDLRKHHGMPTTREKQGLFAHHFYRLLHQVEQCWITYSSAESGKGMDEPSRYIHQIKLELAAQFDNISFHEHLYTIGDQQQSNTPLVVEKNDVLFQRIDEYLNKGTSASALKGFMRCPLDFYYRYLLGFGEEESVEEDIEASTFGNFIHKTLEKLYEPYSNSKEDASSTDKRLLSEFGVAKMLNEFEPILKAEFEDYYKNNKDVVLKGKNLLSFEVAKHLTERFLKEEKEMLSKHKGHLIIDALEKKLRHEAFFTIMNKEINVVFKGFIDRVDIWNDAYRIIDYKSGTCKTEDVTIKSSKGEANLAVVLKNQLKSKKYVFQLLIYQMLFYSEYKRYAEYAGIISLINIKDGPFYLKNELTPDLPSLMLLFKEALTEILNEMYDPSIPFMHAPRSLYCNYCG